MEADRRAQIESERLDMTFDPDVFNAVPRTRKTESEREPEPKPCCAWKACTRRSDAACAGCGDWY